MIWGILLIVVNIAHAQIKEINRVKLTEEQQKMLQSAIDQGLISADDLNRIGQHDDEEEEEVKKFAPQAKDVKRLQSVPNIPAEKTSMLKYLNTLRQAVWEMSGQEVIGRCMEYVKGKPVYEIANMAAWLSITGSEEEPIILTLEAIRMSPDSASYWNNLGALFNLAGMEEYAVPVLKYALALDPQNASVLNNLGQAFLGMGDALRAEPYLKQCLTQHPHHPEAQRSMGIVEATKGNAEKAATYLQKDVEQHLRESSYHLLKMVNPGKYSLAQLKRKFLAIKQYQERNYYEFIALKNLELPRLPYSTDETKRWEAQKEIYLKSLEAERAYWMERSQAVGNSGENYYRYQDIPYYSWLVEALISELSRVYEYDLLPASDIFLNEMSARMEEYMEELMELECEEPPAGADIKVQKAYNAKCNAQKKAIHDAFMARHNEHVRRNYENRRGKWIEFLNEIISAVEICPTPDNVSIAYMYISHYMAFLQQSAGMVQAIPNPMEDSMSEEMADAIIKQSKRNLDLKCPDFLQYDLKIPNIGSINFGCASFKAELSPGLAKASYKKDFKNKTTTMALGVGPSYELPGLTVSASVEGYLVFDKNDRFINSGVSAEAKASLPHGALDLSAIAKVEMNSGYSHEVKTDSRYIQSLKKTIAKY